MSTNERCYLLQLKIHNLFNFLIGEFRPTRSRCQFTMCVNEKKTNFENRMVHSAKTEIDHADRDLLKNVHLQNLFMVR